MKYKLIASDFDETFYSGETPFIPDENKRAVRKYIEAGGKFILSTGRMFRSIRPFALELNLTGEIIAYQGAAVYDIDTSELLMHIPIGVTDAAEILAYIESSGFHCQIYYNDIYYVSRENAYTEYYSKYCNIPVNVAHMPLNEYVLRHNINPTKIMVVTDRDKLIGFYDKTVDKYYGRYGFARSSNKFMEVTSPVANKGVGLKFLLERYGINRSESLAVGDSLNDIPMIRYSGLGVAVGNAMDEVKAAADYITVNSSENAIARIIKMVMRDEL
ncbi:MAG: Cof-type HAD-IIB family hydrolase [Christensenellales bacterium]|jgi:Cof subfamily protein (haloacid dehalogenase superfamily)